MNIHVHIENLSLDELWRAIEKEINKVAKTLDDFKAALADLKTAQTEQLDQTQKLITAVNALVEKVGQSPDFTDLVNDVNAEKDALLADNQAVTDALAKANPPANP